MRNIFFNQTLVKPFLSGSTLAVLVAGGWKSSSAGHRGLFSETLLVMEEGTQWISWIVNVHCDEANAASCVTIYCVLYRSQVFGLHWSRHYQFCLTAASTSQVIFNCNIKYATHIKSYGGMIKVQPNLHGTTSRPEESLRSHYMMLNMYQCVSGAWFVWLHTHQEHFKQTLLGPPETLKCSEYILTLLCPSPRIWRQRPAHEKEQ